MNNDRKTIIDTILKCTEGVEQEGYDDFYDWANVIFSCAEWELEEKFDEDIIENLRYNYTEIIQDMWEREDEYNNYCQDCETIYQWIRLNGGGDLLDSHNIKSGIWLKKAMESGKITPSEIDKVTNKSASGLSFSELPLVKKMDIPGKPKTIKPKN